MSAITTIAADAYAALCAHLEAAYPNEGAGLLLGRAEGDERHVTAVLALPNRWDGAEQFHRFLLTPKDILAGEQEAARRGLDVIGIFHSHPDHPAEPSGFDRDWALPWYLYTITRVVAGRVDHTRAWRLLEDRSGYTEDVWTLPADTGPATSAADHQRTS